MFFFIFKRFGPQRRLHIGEMATKLKQIIDILMFSIVWSIYNTNRDNFMFLLLIYSCYLLFGTFIIPMGIILCFYYCVVKKVLANPRNFMTTVNDKQILNRDNFMFLLLCCKKSVGKRTKVADHG